MKVLFLSPTPRGGTPQYTHALANALSDIGVEVVLITSRGYEFSQSDAKYKIVEVIDRFKISVGQVRLFRKTVRDLKPDVIHFLGAQHPGTYLWLTRLLRLGSPAPFVFSPLDVYSNKNRASEQRTFTKLYGKMSHIIVNTAKQAEMVHEFFDVSTGEITNFPIPEMTQFLHDLPSAPLPDIPENRRLILCFGLIQPRKGIDVLIRAFADMQPKVSDAHLAIVGPPHMDVQPFKDEIAALGIADHVTFRDAYVPFEDMAAYFRRAHLVALPYVVGWTSGALATAFGFGKPVVATTVDAMTEVVKDRQNGLLVPPNEAAPFAQAMARLMQDADLHATLSEGAKNTSQAHSWTHQAEETRAIYARASGGA